jgi:hypothetical protein
MLQPKKKICNACDTEQIIWKNHDGNKYCKSCWFKNQSQPLPKRAAKPIKPKSDKKNIQDQLYTILRNKFFQNDNNKSCKAKLQGCTLIACDVHHLYSGSSRSEHYLNVKEWMPVCRNCHSVIHNKMTKEELISLHLKKI